MQVESIGEGIKKVLERTSDVCCEAMASRRVIYGAECLWASVAKSLQEGQQVDHFYSHSVLISGPHITLTPYFSTLPFPNSWLIPI